MSVTAESVAEAADEPVAANDSQVREDLPTACDTSDPSGYTEPPSDMPGDAVDTDQQIDEDVTDAVMANDEGRAAAATAADNNNGPRSQGQGFVFIVASIVPAP